MGSGLCSRAERMPPTHRFWTPTRAKSGIAGQDTPALFD